jgi:hypothetical protein
MPEGDQDQDGVPVTVAMQYRRAAKDCKRRQASWRPARAVTLETRLRKFNEKASSARTWLRLAWVQPRWCMYEKLRNQLRFSCERALGWSLREVRAVPGQSQPPGECEFVLSSQLSGLGYKVPRARAPRPIGGDDFGRFFEVDRGSASRAPRMIPSRTYASCSVRRPPGTPSIGYRLPTL